jgi:cytoskeleton protein RodZ
MAQDEEQGQTLGVGERLRQAREAMGRSPGDMAEELRLTEEQVHALEAEDYRRLPGEAYVRGYLRNYGAALGLPPEEIMAAYEQRPAGRAEETGEDEAPLIPEPERPLIEHPWRVVWASLALLVVVSVFTVWLVGESQEPGLPEGPVGSSEPGPAEQGGDEPAEPQSAPEAQTGQPATTDSAAASDSTEASEATEPAGATQQAEGAAGDGGTRAAAPGPDEASGAEGGAADGPTAPAASAPEAAGAGAPSGEPTARNGQATLAGPGLDEPAVPELADRREANESSLPQDLQTLRVHTWAESWLEVADDRGRLLLRRLVPEGRDLRLYGQAPFQVKVGNAAGVQLYFEDRPLAPLGGPGQVVRLNVDGDSQTIPEAEVGPPAALSETREAGDDAPTPGPAGAEGDQAPAKRPEGAPKATRQPGAAATAAESGQGAGESDQDGP